MSTFTPRTEYVKAIYVGAVRNSFVASTSEIEQEFDRWLNEHDAEVLKRNSDERDFDYDPMCGEPCKHGGLCTLNEDHDGMHSASGFCVWRA